MRVIGITGGVGAGKSMVLSLLKQHFNADIIMADLVAKELMSKGKAAYLEIVDFFGDGILGTDGEIDRNRLAEIIFTAPNKRIVLNSIVHPLVKQEIIRQIQEDRIAGNFDYCFVEAALLIEDHYAVFLDEIWYIFAKEETRRKRLKQSRQYSDEKIESIFKSQLTEQQFRDASDRIIDNSKDEAYTLEQLKAALQLT